MRIIENICIITSITVDNKFLEVTAETNLLISFKGRDK